MAKDSYARFDGEMYVYDCVRCRMPSRLVVIDLSRVVVGGELHNLEEGHICADQDACLARAERAGRQLKVWDWPRHRLVLIQGGKAAAPVRSCTKRTG